MVYGRENGWLLQLQLSVMLIEYYCLGLGVSEFYNGYGGGHTI
jgi:hypothetical protein